MTDIIVEGHNYGVPHDYFQFDTNLKRIKTTHGASCTGVYFWKYCENEPTWIGILDPEIVYIGMAAGKNKMNDRRNFALRWMRGKGGSDTTKHVAAKHFKELDMNLEHLYLACLPIIGCVMEIKAVESICHWRYVKEYKCPPLLCTG